MCKWQCPLCRDWVSSAFLRNLQILVDEHRQVDCAHKVAVSERRCITTSDARFLEEIKVGW